MKKTAKKPKKIQAGNDFSGLVKFISGKFDNVDERLDNVDTRLDELGEMFRELQGAVDSYAKRADTYFQEMVMLSHQVNRHERWIRQIAEKVGIKLHS